MNNRFFSLVSAALLVTACSGKSGDTAGSGDSGSGSRGTSSTGDSGGSGAGSTGSTAGATSGDPTGGTLGGAVGGIGGTNATNGGSTTSATSGRSTTGAACSGGRASCDDSVDCGGSKSCLNGCCLPVANMCSDGSAAYGPCGDGYHADPTTTCCISDSAPPDAGPVDAGSGTTGGTGGTTGGYTCIFDGGIHGGSCLPECDHGFHCESGACVLNGGNGPLQVTLRWGQDLDLDLHVVEPGGCEIYYGHKTGCVGSLDLDSNAGCGLDHVDVENVIYPPADGGIAPPIGTYTVRVDDWSECSVNMSIPYQVIVRHNGVTDTYCQGFQLGSADSSGQGGGVPVTTFYYDGGL